MSPSGGASATGHPGPTGIGNPTSEHAVDCIMRLRDQEVRPRLIALRHRRERHVVLLGNSTQSKVDSAGGNIAPYHASDRSSELLGSARRDPSRKFAMRVAGEHQSRRIEAQRVRSGHLGGQGQPSDGH